MEALGGGAVSYERDTPALTATLLLFLQETTEGEGGA